MHRRLFAIVIVLFAICCSWTATAPAAENNRIMVMPIDVKDDGQKQAVPRFSELLQEYFAGQPGVLMVGEDKLESLLGNATGNRQQLVRVAGEKLNCQAALLITLVRFRERLGDEYSTTDAASLAFEFRLVSTADGKVLCYGQFDETQQPLSENILAIGKAFKRGFKWITVADLTREALEQKFRDCPELSATIK